MKTLKLFVCTFLLCAISATTLGVQDRLREPFWQKFRAAVIGRNKTAVASLTKYPLSLPYGMGTIGSKAQLLKRYRDVFNHEGDAAVCFADAKPTTDPARPKEFTIGCKNAAGDEVVIYSFVLTKFGWRFNGLDNLNE
jgi:hypothetical protein